MDFTRKARNLTGKSIRVKTVDGVITGKLLAVGSDFLTLLEEMSEKPERIIIRTELIVALARIFDPKPNGNVHTDHHHQELAEDNDEFETFMMDVD